MSSKENSLPYSLPPEQLPEARANLERYFDVALQIVRQDDSVDRPPGSARIKERSSKTSEISS